MVLLLVVDDRLLELAGEDVARHAHRQVRLLEDHLGRLRLLRALLEHVVELVEVLDLALEVLARGALRRGADDHAALAEVDLAGRAPAQPVALLVLEPARHADALALRHVHEVAPRDRELHRQARALRLQRVLDRLDQDLLVRLEELARSACPCRRRGRRGRAARPPRRGRRRRPRGGSRSCRPRCPRTRPRGRRGRCRPCPCRRFRRSSGCPCARCRARQRASRRTAASAAYLRRGCPPIPGSRLLFRPGPPRRATAFSRSIPFIKVIGASPRPSRAPARGSIAVGLLP